MSDADTTLRIERLIAAPPEVLFALWIEPAQLLKWWAPDGYEPSVDILDARPGGRWRTMMRRPDGGVVATSGVYRVVEPPYRLSFTWAWESEHGARGHESEVAVTFEAAAGGTRLVLLQQRFENKETCDRHVIGWSAALDRMAWIAR
ncbi:SRPBCC family protein [Bradyrhizobium sp. B120]|uniref:SRPBCC family protein n=1 Tax=Bradyrhizobium sp. B120 TaxID=3410088 RepID=UPI003B97F4E2